LANDTQPLNAVVARLSVDGNIHRAGAAVGGKDLQIGDRHRVVAIEHEPWQVRKVTKDAGNRRLMLRCVPDRANGRFAPCGFVAEIDYAVSCEGVTVIEVSAGGRWV
jgi:hypothetical protein